MNIIELLGRTTILSTSEQIEVDRHLASAYAIDESAATNTSIARIAGKIESYLSPPLAESTLNKPASPGPATIL